jgi:hypothetical protein
MPGGDEHLLAVDDVFVAFAPRRGAQGRDVRAAARLGDRQRRDLLAAQHRRDHLLLQAPRCHAAAIGGRPMLCENRLAITPPLPPQRLIATHSALRSACGAGVPPSSSGIAQAQQADRRRLAVQGAGNLAGLLPLRHDGRDAILHEAPHAGGHH